MWSDYLFQKILIVCDMWNYEVIIQEKIYYKGIFFLNIFYSNRCHLSCSRP